MGCVGLCLTPELPKSHLCPHKDMDQELRAHSAALLPYLYSLCQSVTAEMPPSDEQGECSSLWRTSAEVEFLVH